MRRGKQWQAKVDAIYTEAIALGEVMQRKQSQGKDFAAERERFRWLVAEYNRLHGAGAQIA
jgi:hypothetical protein